MAELTGVRTTAFSGSSYEDRQVRYVDERIFLYAPQYCPILLLKGGIMPGPRGERIKVKGIIESVFAPASKVEWYDKDLLGQDMYHDHASISSTIVSIAVDNGAGALTKAPRVGDIIEVVGGTSQTTGEVLYVQAVSVGATEETLTVVRGIGGTTADTILDNAIFRIVSNAQKNHSTKLTPRNALAGKLYNYMQIGRDDWGVSRSEDRIRLYGGRDKAETMAEAAVNHVRLIERQLVFGVREGVNALAADGTAAQLAGGLRYFITNIYASASGSSGGLFGSTHVSGSAVGHGGTVDMATEFLETFLREGFRYGNNQRRKLFLGGSVFGILFNRLAGTTSTIRTRTKQTVFGVQITEVISAFGTVDYLPSGAIEEFASGEGYLIDPENVKFRYLDNTFMVDNTQSPDADGYEGYFLTEYSLSVQGLKTHSRITGVTGPA